ncbi:HNH endonuclease [Nitriliruptoraceae bacterium ZYF776]|nr:HNH endonuclease [Profundirhabdus halotolerans]
MLRTAADMLGSLPHLRAAFLEGAVSWAQLRTVLLQVRDARLPLDERLDTTLAGAVGSADGGDPDELARQVRWRLWDLAPDVADRQTVPGPERLVLQPRLDGTGGEVHGDLGPLTFAALDAATRPESDVAGPDRAARRAERLAELCLTDAPDDRSIPGADDVRRPAARVHLLLRAELETLLGDDGRPAQLLTSLAGGVMHVDASTAARLAGRAGSLRLVVTDHGAPVGIGRRSRHAPAWLRDAILALHDTCARPGCDRPASTADLDHAHRWSDGGPTDVANLAPLCAHHNRRRGGWHVSQQPDGTRHWRHALTGVHATSRPARPTRRAEPPDGERGRADPRPPPR